MTRHCNATHPTGGIMPPRCSHEPGHGGPHVAGRAASSPYGPIPAGGETWDNEEDVAQTHVTAPLSAEHPRPGTRSHRDDERPAEPQPRSYEDGIR